ncbi:AAEL007246-PA [Aedes aegypti]|uniref:AAEL007246-PA n=1 Tax=Aedes aegypti TaxID=7159 RepID=Q172X7_AEDAE|nr:AAEL007246-PA [Aedes aegypti]
MVNPLTPPVLREPVYWHFGDQTLNREARDARLDRRDRLTGLRWVWACNGAVPENGIPAGGSGSRRYYIGRAHYEGSVTPGRVDLKRKACSIAWGGDEHLRNVYEVLCTPGRFVRITEENTESLLLASTAGMSEEGEPLFIGRVEHKGEMIYGKVQRSHGVCYIAYEGKELAFKTYELFVANVPMRLDSSYWLPNFKSDIPEHATVGGGTPNKSLYIGRAKHRGSLTPGSVDPETWQCHIAWGSDEHRKTYFEYLCRCSGRFVKSQGNHLPIGAIRGGYSEYGEPLFIGRVKMKEGYIVGKVQPSHAVCYIPYRGKEIAYKKYEILVQAD